MAVADFTRARDRLRRLDDDPNLTATLEATQAALHDVVTFSWSALMTVDPDTLLPTGGLVEGFAAEACAPFWDNELLAPGYNKFTDLARSTTSVATLFEATDGDLGPGTDLLQPLLPARGRRRAPRGLRGRFAMLGCRQPSARTRRRPVHRR